MAVLIIFLLFLGIGSVLGWVAFLKINGLRQQIELLKRQARSTADRLDSLLGDQPRQTCSTEDSGLAGEQSGYPIETAARPSADPAAGESHATTDRQGTAGEDTWTGSGDTMAGSSASRVRRKPRTRQPNPWIQSLREQWMIWLGGLSVSLAGIFLVRYSIEQGLLGPTARIGLGIATGLVLHLAAEILRRHNKGQYNAFAALAGGASITLYAALLAALLLYELLAPVVVFGLLALVSLVTMSLALVHGPVLAILGILGAYIAPILVETGSDSILGLYLYSLIISAAAILLMRRVYRVWLWTGMLAGSLGWWYLSLLTDSAAGYRGYYLAAVAYLYLALPAGDWLLQKLDGDGWFAGIDGAWLRNSLVVVVLSLGLGILVDSSVAEGMFYWTPLVVILAVAGGSRSSLRWIPVLSLPVQLAAWFVHGLGHEESWRLAGLFDPFDADFTKYAAWMSILYVVLFGYNFLRNRHVLWLATGVLTPLAWLALCYLLVTDLAESVYWSATAVVLGVLYLSTAAWQLRRAAGHGSDAKSSPVAAIWLLAAGHFAYSLAVAIMFREATLSLALAAQLVSLTWLIRRFDFPQLDLAVKAVLGVVITRLTLNPWLLTYPDDVHWSLWTYGGATLLAGIAARIATAQPDLRKWLEAATLHLLVLTLWAETRYWLYDGNIFSPRLELTEFAINTALWSTLSLVYYRRYLVSRSLANWYLLASRGLLGLSVLGYALVLLPLNPAWGLQQLDSTPILNMLLLAYGYPVIICLLLMRYYEPDLRRYFAYAFCVTAFVFVNLEIRHLWQGSVSLSLPTGNGELYTYTIVWLLFAVMALLAGSIRLGKSVYQGGMALMMLVVAKIFLVDMADLEGLLRVTSFMGLGLCLLGLAYLYQRFNLSPDSSGTGDSQGTTG